MTKNYYTLFGLKEDCNKKDIRSAYLGLALKYHPDKNTSDRSNDKFNEIQKAYEILYDDKKRELYDIRLNSEKKKPEKFDLDTVFNYIFDKYDFNQEERDLFMHYITSKEFKSALKERNDVFDELNGVIWKVLVKRLSRQHSILEILLNNLDNF